MNRSADPITAPPGASVVRSVLADIAARTRDPRPIPTTTVAPAVDGVRALIALGELTDAANRRCLYDLIGAWIRYAQACDREDLLRLPAPVAARPVLPDGNALTALVDLALATARNVAARDAERHWQTAGRAFAQLTANLAARCGEEVAGTLRRWERAGWIDDEDEAPIDDAMAADLLVHLAARAAHYGRLVIGELPFNEASWARRDAAQAVDGIIRRALQAAHLQYRVPLTDDGEETATVCTHCQGEDGCQPSCALAPFTAFDLTGAFHVARYRGVR